MSKIALEGNASGTGTFTVAAPNSNSNYTLTLPENTGTIVTTGGASSLTTSGNLTFTGTGNRITGDFSNATVANRVAFQTSTVNGATQATVIPNGSGTVANFGFFNNSDPSNAAGFFVGTANAGTEARLNSTITGTGTYLPMTFYTGGSERMRIDTSGNVGIGTSSPLSASNYVFVTVQGGSSGGGYIQYNSSGSRIGQFTQDSTTAYLGNFSNNPLVFQTNNTERARITSAGRFLIGTTSYDDQIPGTGFGENGFAYHVVAGGTCLNINRQTNDGILINFQQDNVSEGNISVSGNTVSYNAFAGSHWSQLQQGRGYNPEILRGTVMSSIGEMCEWKSVTWTETIEHPAVPAVEAKEAVVDEEGNVIEPAVEAVEGKDAWTETINKREAYLGQLPVGATFEEDGVTKTVVDDGNERLPKVKISDVVGDKAVYGVFQTYDDVQDMLVTSLGAFVVRIAAGVTVQIGDLLESNGDGCAKVQDDDVIRSKTIGKVTSITPTATYADGSYTVPAVLYCG